VVRPRRRRGAYPPRRRINQFDRAEGDLLTMTDSCIDERLRRRRSGGRPRVWHRRRGALRRRHLEGPLLDLAEDALRSTAAKQRGLFRPEYVDGLLREPDQHTPNTGANRLWQLALLELWLQTHGVG
jgi:hypothetical protein